MNTDAVIQKARKALTTEMFASAVYQYLAAKYRGTTAGNAFAKIAEMEQRHVRFWSDFLRKRGVDTSSLKYSAISFIFHKLLLRIIGKGLTLRIIENGEVAAIELYSSMLESRDLSKEEQAEISRVIGDELFHEDLLCDEEAHLGSLTAYIRDAVLGMSDGLVEIVSVTTGLAGATGSPRAVAIGGLVVGVAGGISMAISTYASARSQRQVHEGILNRIFSASKFVAHILKERVIDRFEKRGYSQKLSSEAAEETVRNPGLLSSVIAEQEYGLREENLGSPTRAASYAGLAHFLAAFFPLVPYFFAASILFALIISLALATVALAITGFFVSVLANVSSGKKMAEMILTGLGAAALTYAIGKAASVLLGTGV